MYFLRNFILKSLYKLFVKPLLFQFDPEKVHDQMTRNGVFLGKFAFTRKFVSWLFSYAHPSLGQNILGIHFKNPVGLAAGFDKNAELVDIIGSVGFGFSEVGSITGKPCEGNPKPRLWRLKKSKALMIYYGLKNDGCEALSKKLSNRRFALPVGISVAKTNCAETVDTQKGIDDYKKAYAQFTNIGDYTTINISCPNAFGGEPFTDPEKLDRLLSEIDTVHSKKPIFLKISPDLSKEQISAIFRVVEKHKVDGFICANLTKDRKNGNIKDGEVPKNGGMSGKIVEQAANDLIRYVYRETQGKYVVIGCGGIFSAVDAYTKIRLGASLVQMITGMIYEGPQVISEINRGLVKLLKRDGFTHISEAVGVDNKIWTQ